MYRNQRVLLGVCSTLFALLMAGCTTNVTTTSYTITIAAPSALMVGSSSQLIATVIPRSGTSTQSTSQVAWTSQSPSILGINASGNATCLSGGDSVITASYKESSATASIKCTSVVSISISPKSVFTI